MNFLQSLFFVGVIGSILGTGSTAMGQTVSGGNPSAGDSILQTSQRRSSFVLTAGSFFVYGASETSAKAAYHYSTATGINGANVGFAAEAGLNLIGEALVVNAGVGAELRNNTFFLEALVGAAVIAVYPIPLGCLDLNLGFDIPIGGGTALRIQGGPTFYGGFDLGGGTGIVTTMHAGIGVAFR